jgi:hypothetical protein
VPYLLQASDEQRANLYGLPLSDQAKGRLRDFLDTVVCTVSDDYRAQADVRPAPGSTRFFMWFLLHDVWGDEQMHNVRLVPDDANAAFGVLLLLYADHTQWEVDL